MNTSKIFVLKVLKTGEEMILESWFPTCCFDCYLPSAHSTFPFYLLLWLIFSFLRPEAVIYLCITVSLWANFNHNVDLLDLIATRL